MQLAGLGVDEVGGERARVAAEERVRERAVAPEEPAEVEAHEQLGARVEQPPAQVGDAAAREQRAVRQREVEVPRDQDGLELVAAVGDDADRLDDRHLVGREARSSPYSRRATRRGQLLERVERRPVAPSYSTKRTTWRWMPRTTSTSRSDLPLLERLVPRQVEEVGMPGPGDELQPGGHSGRRTRARV